MQVRGLEGEIRGVKEDCDKLLSQQRHLQSKLHALEEELGRIHSKVTPASPHHRGCERQISVLLHLQHVPSVSHQPQSMLHALHDEPGHRHPKASSAFSGAQLSGRNVTSNHYQVGAA